MPRSRQESLDGFGCFGPMMRAGQSSYSSLHCQETNKEFMMMRSVFCLLPVVLGCSADVGPLFGGGGDGAGGENTDNGAGGGGALNTGGMNSSTGGAPEGGNSSQTVGGGGMGGSPMCDVDAHDPGDIFFHDIECANCLEARCCELMVTCISGDDATECNGNWLTVQECIEQNQQNCWLQPTFPNAPYWDEVKACKEMYCTNANCQ